jgi:hypothetical protein
MRMVLDNRAPTRLRAKPIGLLALAAEPEKVICAP